MQAEICIFVSDLLKPLSLAVSLIETKPDDPLLSFVALSFQNKRLMILSSNLDIESIIFVDLKIEIDCDLKVALPGRKLLDICRVLSSETKITFAICENKVTLKSGTSHFVLTAKDFTEFPRLPVTDADIHFSLSQQELKKFIQSTSFAISRQDVRYFLMGMFWDIRFKNNSLAQLNFIAADGHRMAIASAGDVNIKLNNADLLSQQHSGVIVPLKCVKEINSLLNDSDEKIDIHLSSQYISFSSNIFSLKSRLISGNYPEYEQIIPRSVANIIKIEKNELVDAIKKVAVLCQSKSPALILFIQENLMHISSKNHEQECAKDSVSIDYDGNNELEICFNANYLLDVLNIFSSGQIIMKINDSNSAVILETSNMSYLKYIIMPMTL